MDSITSTESMIDRLKKMRAEQVSELRQQNRKAKRQIIENTGKIVTLQQKRQDLDKKLVGLRQDLERVNGLEVENDRLRLFLNEAMESELPGIGILGLIHGASSNVAKMCVKFIYVFSEVKPLDRVMLCLAVMASTKEGDTINCYRKVAVDFDKRRKRSQKS
jgi:hypothetical protein